MHLRQFKVSLFASVALVFSSVMGVQAQDERISKVPNLGGGQTLNECGSSFLDLSGNFDGFEIDGDTFTFPTGAQSWAGTANLNTDLYPLSFPSGGELRFKAEIPEGGADTSINFKFERLPYPDTEPSFSTDNSVISGAETDYVISIPAQDASHTFSSLLMFIVERDQSVIVRDVQVITAGDGDGDGVPDASDEFPSDPAASIDSDGDGSPDDWNTCATSEDIAASTLTLDADDDDDGTPDLQDSLPLNPYHSNPDLAAFSAAFGGAVIDGVNYSVPTGAEVWAGFANENAALYPLSFATGGKVTFTGSVADGGSADVRFRLEYKPHPDVDPAYDTVAVTVSGSTPTEYTIDIPSQGSNTYESLLLYVDTPDVSVTLTDISLEAVTAIADADGDGVADADDAFPSDPAASVDTDSDGSPDDWNDGATAAQIEASTLTVDEDDDNDLTPDTSDIRPLDPNYADPTFGIFTGSFGGSVIDGVNFSVPTGAEVWAGFANENLDLYPFAFPDGGQITFTGSVASGGSADVRFRFEYKPHPDVDPAYDTVAVTVAGSTPAEYVIDIPSQGSKTFESFLMYVDTPDVSVTVTSVLVTELDAVTDADGDGVDDADDAFPSDPAASVDTDGDGMPDDWNEGATQAEIDASTLMVDEDDDGDGVADVSDSRPLDPNFSDASAAEFSEAFGGAYYADGLYVNPEAAESWAGFANMNTALYPISFPYGGQISFTASVPLDGSADIYFRFEKNPHPDTEPSYNTDPVTVSGTEPTTYTVDVPAQGENNFASFLMYVQTLGVAVAVSDVQLAFTDGPAADPTLADFSEAFGGTTIGEDGSFMFPTGAEPWAGFANMNTAMYPLSFSEAAHISFTASVPSGGSADIYFRFEKNPHPDTEPSYNTAPVTISGSESMTYTVDVPSQGENTFASFLMYVQTQDVAVMVSDVRIVDGPAPDPTLADFSEAFGGAVIGEGGTYTFPTGAEPWAGFANMNTTMYPLAFPAGGKITFMASVPDGGSADVYFRFEKNPHPDTEPSYNTEPVTISGTDHLVYEVEVPSQGENTFASFILYVQTPDEPVMIMDVRVESYDDPEGPVDTDMDGVPDDDDAFPTDPAASVDTDGDGMPDDWNEGATAEQIAASALTVDEDDDGDGTPDVSDIAPLDPAYADAVADFSEAFGGTTIGEDGSFMFPTGAEPWAGFANMNTAMYPLSFSEAAHISFTASVPSGGSADIYFRFEKNPHPDTEPSYNTAPVTISGSESMTYTVDVPAQGENTFASFLMYVQTQDVAVMVSDVRIVDGPAPDPTLADFSEAFGGAVIGEGGTYTFPTGAEPWAGFANMNTTMYPLAFPAGGKITFMASVPDGGSADVYFRFEKNPHPDTEPSYNTASVTISGSDHLVYEVEVPEQGTNTFASFLLYVQTPDVPVMVMDVRVESYEDPDGPSVDPTLADFSEAFGGTTIGEDGTYTFPTGAEPWAGFANMNTAMYPLSFSEAAHITFTASVPSGGSADVYFRFEKNPHPDTEPSYNTAPVTISGSESMTYTVDVPSQGENTFASFLMYVQTQDVAVMVSDVRIVDGPAPDPTLADFSEAFGGAVIGEGGTYTFPTGAEPWAGFANINTALYPFEFPEGAHITFMASVPDGGSADVYFRFEKNPHPDTEPSYNTEPVTISGSDMQEYSVDVPSQGVNTFASFILYVQTPDVPVVIMEVRVNDGLNDDSDGDGVVNDEDDFPYDAAASVDTDGDGMPDDWNEGATSEQIIDSGLMLDSDDDNDGFSDADERAGGSDPLSADSVPYTHRSRIPFYIPILQNLG